MNSPIKNKINTVFIPVTNLERSAAWYSRLLGQEYKENEAKRPVFNVKMSEYTGLTLDAGTEDNPNNPAPSNYPIFNFHTDSIGNARQYIKEMGYEGDIKIVKFADFSFFTIKDPDGNIIMICNG
ncbi:VOC family protein [Peribacillus sp. B-H-3]|uniref:VOC family protein n=1 Tax=Peribacillus sp. B-H-3 TaxID=3400420 RepID=UPI003B029E95